MPRTMNTPVLNDKLTSIVILSYNRLDDVKNNIDSLYEHTHRPFEVIILDNGSQRETVDYLRSIDGYVNDDGNGRIKVIYSPTNLGCSGGRKEAVKYASGDYIYTVDNDMTYTGGWLEALVERAESDPNIGAICSKIVYPNDKIQLNGGVLELEDDYFGSFIEFDAGKYWDSDDLTGEMDCDWICGGATLFKRGVVSQVEHAVEYLNGFEDYDYAFQIAGLGYRLVNCPDSIVIHHHIGFDEEKQQKEKDYLNDRWNPKRTWPSLVYFLERTGINTVKASGFYDWIEADGTKPFLQWGQVAGMPVVYDDLFPGRAFSDLYNWEVMEQFNHIIDRNKEVRGRLQNGGETTYFAERRLSTLTDIVEGLSGAMDECGFYSYNLSNLSGHLGWVMRSDLKGREKLSRTDVNYLVNEFRKSTETDDPELAESVYSALRERLTCAFGTTA